MHSVRLPVQTGAVRILLKFTIDCDADAAWRAMHSPRAIAEVYGPLIDLHPLADLPTSWEPGNDVAVGLVAGGLLPLGTQLISVSERHPESNVRVLRDSGVPLTGPLAALDIWDHQMAVSPDPADPGRTLWRERLVIGGRAAPLLWPTLWATWQWRGARIRALAPTWAHDPEPTPES